MSVATPSVDRNPKTKACKDAMNSLGRFCMDNLPDEALADFIALYNQTWTAWLDLYEADTNKLQELRQQRPHDHANERFRAKPWQRN